jgi:hypothetical protein
MIVKNISESKSEGRRRMGRPKAEISGRCRIGRSREEGER